MCWSTTKNTPTTETREFSWCQLCRRQWHQRLSLWYWYFRRSDDKVGIMTTLGNQWKLCVMGSWFVEMALLALCEGNLPMPGEFPSQEASDTERASMLWRHRVSGVNEDDPVYTSMSYTPSVDEDAAVNDVVTTIAATDADNGPDGTQSSLFIIRIIFPQILTIGRVTPVVNISTYNETVLSSLEVLTIVLTTG